MEVWPEAGGGEPTAASAFLTLQLYTVKAHTLQGLNQPGVEVLRGNKVKMLTLSRELISVYIKQISGINWWQRKENTLKRISSW